MYSEWRCPSFLFMIMAIFFPIISSCSHPSIVFAALLTLRMIPDGLMAIKASNEASIADCVD